MVENLMQKNKCNNYQNALIEFARQPLLQILRCPLCLLSQHNTLIQLVVSQSQQYKMEGEVKMVQDHLNKLCAQHDELMSLLDIYDYMPNTRLVGNVNRNIANKLTSFQQHIDSLQHTPTTSSEHGGQSIVNVKARQFEECWREAGERISDAQSRVTSLKQELIKEEEMEDRGVDRVIDELEREARKIFDDATTEISNNMAEYKIRVRRRVCRDGRHNSHHVLERVAPQLIYLFQKVEHDIQQKTLQFKTPPLLSFSQFTYQQLTLQLEHLSKAWDLLAESEGDPFKPRATQTHLVEQVARLHRDRESLEYRWRALQRFCGEQLLIRYIHGTPFTQSTQQETNREQMRLKGMLSDIEDKLSVLKQSQNSFSSYAKAQ